MVAFQAESVRRCGKQNTVLVNYALAKRQGKEGETMRLKIIGDNMGIAHNIAKKYQGMGLDYEELLQEGRIGILLAIKHYKPKLGGRFCDYAATWIKKMMLEAIADSGSLIRLTRHVFWEIKRIMDVRKAAAKRGEKLNENEIARETGFSVQKVQRLLKAEEIRQVVQPNTSQNEEGKEKVPPLDRFPARDNSPEKITHNHAVAVKLTETLTPRELAVSQWNFILEGNLMEFGRKMQLTRGQVYIARDRALKKMRAEASRLTD